MPRHAAKKIGRDEVVREQPIARRDAESFEVERGPVREGRLRAHGVNAAEETAHPFERRAVLELRRAATASADRRQSESRRTRAASRRRRERRDDRNLARGELGDERVLFVESAASVQRSGR